MSAVRNLASNLENLKLLQTGVGAFCPSGSAFAEKFCPAAGLLTIPQKIPLGIAGGGGGGGCWRLELNDALVSFIVAIHSSCL